MLSYHVIGAKTDAEGKLVMESRCCDSTERLQDAMTEMIKQGFATRVYYGEQVLLADDLSSIHWGGSTVYFENKKPKYVECIEGEKDG